MCQKYYSTQVILCYQSERSSLLNIQYYKIPADTFYVVDFEEASKKINLLRGPREIWIFFIVTSYKILVGHFYMKMF